MRIIKRLSEDDLAKIIREWFKAKGQRVVRGGVYLSVTQTDRPGDSQKIYAEVEVEEL